MVEAEGAVAAQQPVIAEKPAGGIANDDVGSCPTSGAGRFVEQAAIIPEPRARAGNSQVRTRNLATGSVVEDDCRVARREPRPGRGVDQMAECVVSRLPKPKEQSGRQSGSTPGVGLRLVAIGQNRIEDVSTKKRLSGMNAFAMTIAKTCN